MAFWHFCQNANCITKSAFSRLFHWIRLLDFPALITTLFRFSIFMLIKWLHGVVIIATKGEVKSCRITASLDHSPGQALLLLHSALGLKYKYRCRRQIQIRILIVMKIQIDWPVLTTRPSPVDDYTLSLGPNDLPSKLVSGLWTTCPLHFLKTCFASKIDWRLK